MKELQYDCAIILWTVIMAANSPKGYRKNQFAVFSTQISSVKAKLFPLLLMMVIDLFTGNENYKKFMLVLCLRRLMRGTA
jgi:hypothetical protein